MTLEALLTFVCIYGSQESCMKFAEGYYHERHLEEVEDNIKRRIHPNVIFTASVVRNAVERKATVPVYRHTYVTFDMSSGNGDSKFIVGYNKDF